MQIPPVYQKVAGIFEENGYQCFLVGGAIRDMLMARPAKDYDIATDARAEDLMGLFRKVIPTGIKHGTVTVLFGGTQFEVTTFRIEGEYRDGRRPDRVIFTPSILEDLKRRDFTMNAIAYDLIRGELLDPHNGISDLKTGTIRAIDDPVARFREDGLRPIRACRFAAQFGFCIEENTRDSIGKSLSTVAKVSAERVRDELCRMLTADTPSRGFKLLEETGILRLVIPELHDCVCTPIDGMPNADLFLHVLALCDAVAGSELDLRLAALLHQIDTTDRKPSPDTEQGRGPADGARRILRRLKFPNATVSRVCHLIANQIPADIRDWDDVELRRFMSRAERQAIGDLLTLKAAHDTVEPDDAYSTAELDDLSLRIDKILTRKDPLSLGDLRINGRDLMEHLGLRSGPSVGRVLGALLDAVLVDPVRNKPTTLLQIARQWYCSHRRAHSR